MDYIINPAQYTSIFAVPTSLVDDHIRLAGSAQLKVLLWILKNGSGANSNDMASALGLAHADAIDAMQYWIGSGVLIPNNEIAKNQKHSESTNPPCPKAEISPIGNTLERPLSPAGKPSREEVAKRGADSPEIQFLLNEAQQKMGRLVSQNEASTLVWLHDYEGLPVSVILMVIEYALSEGKRSMKYIEKTAINWAEQNINTLTRVEKHIQSLNARKSAWRIVESAFSIDRRRPSEREQNYALTWVNEWGFSKEMLSLAYNECVDSTSKLSMPYINKILEKWHKMGYKKPADLKNEKKPLSLSKQQSNTSYDINLLQDLLLK